ncbi:MULTISPECIES: helix-turn-helix domain-containing protein [unclassified Pedobacter]|uniref:helix-turn-helix domain-containing protein n=1 Tax=unclassified Pedobacter TaxID=2628915 RepID=UPI00141E7392|nr:MULTISPECIES: helix-turn-helix transcriptional regulator [unclassified Pedobacter]NII82001.1 AraC-like DNA-binding protein [Pedobacter sp. SG908]NMN36005.1 AraC-like DNA-binding protein [Pedobacter sp. SG918]
MKKVENSPYKFSSLTEAHRMLGLPQPKHPLISLINNEDHPVEMNGQPNSHILNFYKISYKPKLSGRLKYGQSYYDFDEGGLLFAAPNQIIGHEEDLSSSVCSLFTLLIHPDFLLSYPIAKKIKSYGFFSYAANEALHLSEKEKTTIIAIFKNIEEELNSRIDDFSQDVIIAQIELLLNYSNRFYKRQFITRKVLNNGLLQKLEELLEEYFNNKVTMLKGLPTVQYLSDHLNVSPSYLSDLLRSLTGQNAQQHIHQKLIEKAKEKLSGTNLSVSEVAYELGFEHSQSFNKLFKAKTKVSPLAFRKMFN